MFKQKKLFINNNIKLNINLELNPLSDTLITYLHGYRDNAFENKLHTLPLYIGKQYNHIFLDFRNHGNSSYFKFYPTIKDRVEDLTYYFEYIKNNYSFSRHIVIGYSQGATVLLEYLKNLSNNISKVILISPRIFLKRFLQRFNLSQLEEWDTKGSIIKNENNKLINFNKDFLNEIKSLNILEKIEVINKPMFLFYGEKDESVLNDEILSLINNSPSIKLFYKLINETHSISEEGYSSIAKILNLIVFNN